MLPECHGGIPVDERSRGKGMRPPKDERRIQTRVISLPGGAERDKYHPPVSTRVSAYYYLYVVVMSTKGTCYLIRYMQ